VQVFLAAMIFDGVFDRHPNLRAISMEHGGFWLPSWLRSLEFARDTFKRRRRFDSSPMELAMERIKVSPFAGEPIGWIIDNSSPDMLCFASDFPHPEGTGDPIGKFEATMTNCDAATMDKFYRGNLMSLIAGR
jgi:predicted TIM-barrel fold metal-dependent hydrolase